jgi:hypothetical protein
VGPTPIFPWHGHSGYTLVVRANGSGECLAGGKRDRIPAWATK